jgi:hypothetical protein
MEALPSVPAILHWFVVVAEVEDMEAAVGSAAVDVADLAGRSCLAGEEVAEPLVVALEAGAPLAAGLPLGAASSVAGSAAITIIASAAIAESLPPETAITVITTMPVITAATTAATSVHTENS